jgi:hypothetical protein
MTDENNNSANNSIPKPIRHLQPKPKAVEVKYEEVKNNGGPKQLQVQKQESNGQFSMSIPVEEMRKAKIFVATPMYGGQCNGLYMKACLDLQMSCAKYGIDCRFSFIFNESLITRARNYLTDEFIRTDMTHLLFIDSDIHFDPNDVLAMLALSLSQPEMDIIGGPYPKKSINWANVALAARNHPTVDPKEFESLVGDFVFNPAKGGAQQFNVIQPLEVMEVGTGFMLIRRNVFDKFVEAFPEKSYKPDHRGTANFDGSREIHAFFDCVIDPETKRYLSEDYMFCQYSRKMGCKVWLCPWMRTQHIGSYAFTGDMRKIAQYTGQLFP